MFTFPRFSIPRHRRTKSHSRLCDVVSALESRQLPTAKGLSAAIFPLPATEQVSPSQVSPSAQANVIDFSGNWKIDSDPTLTLSWTQDSHNKLAGVMYRSSMVDSISLDIKGKVNPIMSFHGKGIFLDQQAKVTYTNIQTTTINGVLVQFSGELTIKYKGSPKMTFSMNADKI